jgi:hypothetical protein
MEKFYIIQSEYVCHGMTFNRKRRNVRDLDRANEVFDEVLNAMKIDNSDMLEDKENYVVNKGNRRGQRFFSCAYKYQPDVSNFTVEMWSENLE